MKNLNISLNRILFSVLCFIAIIFAVSTVYVFASKKADPGKNLRKSDPSPEQVERSHKDSGKVSSFTGIERIRAVTSAEEKYPNGVSVVITPWFSYTYGDTDFFEELSRKSSQIRAKIVVYFSENTYSELRKKGERKIKDELLSKINEGLSLSKIKEIYFSEFVYLE